MKIYTLRPDTFTLNFNVTLSRYYADIWNLGEALVDQIVEVCWLVQAAAVDKDSDASLKGQWLEQWRLCEVQEHNSVTGQYLMRFFDPGLDGLFDGWVHLGSGRDESRLVRFPDYNKRRPGVSRTVGTVMDDDDQGRVKPMLGIGKEDLVGHVVEIFYADSKDIPATKKKAKMEGRSAEDKLFMSSADRGTKAIGVWCPATVKTYDPRSREHEMEYEEGTLEWSNSERLDKAKSIRLKRGQPVVDIPLEDADLALGLRGEKLTGTFVEVLYNRTMGAFETIEEWRRGRVTKYDHGKRMHTIRFWDGSQAIFDLGHNQAGYECRVYDPSDTPSSAKASVDPAVTLAAEEAAALAVEQGRSEEEAAAAAEVKAKAAAKAAPSEGQCRNRILSRVESTEETWDGTSESSVHARLSFGDEMRRSEVHITFAVESKNLKLLDVAIGFGRCMQCDDAVLIKGQKTLSKMKRAKYKREKKAAKNMKLMADGHFSRSELELRRVFSDMTVGGKGEVRRERRRDRRDIHTALLCAVYVLCVCLL